MSDADRPRITLIMIRAAAIGLSQAMEHMSAEERVTYPSDAFVSNYNRLVAQTTLLMPHLTPILPPTVATYEDESRVRMAEIWSFCTQLAEVIARELSDNPNA